MKLEQIFYFHAEEIIKGDTIGADDKGMFGLKEFTELRQTAIHTSSSTLYF